MVKAARALIAALAIFVIRDLAAAGLQAMDGMAFRPFSAITLLDGVEALVAGIALAWLAAKELDFAPALGYAALIAFGVRVPALVASMRILGLGEYQAGAPFWISLAMQALVFVAASVLVMGCLLVEREAREIRQASGKPLRGRG